MKKIIALSYALTFGLALVSSAVAAEVRPDKATCDQVKQMDQASMSADDAKIAKACKKAGM